MIIGIWIVLIVVSIVVLGEVRHRCFEKNTLSLSEKVLKRSWSDSIDVDMDNLTMECVEDDFVSAQALAIRGSWRLAQNQVWGLKTFEVLKEEEYAKEL